MKRNMRILVLVGVLVIACAATFGVTRHEEQKEQIKNSDEIILELSGDTVTSLSWEYEENALSFHKDEVWVYDEDEAFPVDDKKIGELIEQFEAFGASFVIEEVEDYSQYGLVEPICTIHLGTEEQSYEIKLGNFSNMDSERYVSIGDGNVYLVKNDPLEQFDAVLDDVMDHDELPVFDQVTEVQFAGTEEYTFAYVEESTDSYCAEDVYFTERDEKKVPLDTGRVEDYLDGISNLALTDYVTYHATEEDLQTYGMDNPEMTVTVNHTVENEDEEEITETFVLYISRDPEERKAAEEEEAESTGDEEVAAYVRVGESPIIYQVTTEEYRALMSASYDSLRHLEILSASFTDIYRIDISLEEESYTVTSEEEDGVRTYYYGEEELTITDLRSAIRDMEATAFTEEEPEEKQEIAFTVYLENENFPKVEIELYRYDGSQCLAVVDGETVAFVERAQVVELIEAVHAIVLK